MDKLFGDRCVVWLVVVAAALHGCLAAGQIYTNSWAVEVTEGKERADELAKKYGFTNRGQV